MAVRVGDGAMKVVLTSLLSTNRIFLFGGICAAFCGGAILTRFPNLIFPILGFTVLAASLAPLARKLEIEELLIFPALLGYIVLDYGFANWSLRIAGIPLPIGHILSFGALGAAIYRIRDRLHDILREPAVVFLLLLIGMSIPHLLLNLPRYGGYAIRDTSFVVEGLFLILGMCLAEGDLKRGSHRFLKALICILLINVLYSFTFPFSSFVREITPWVNGPFLEAPLLGGNSNMGLYLILGCFLFLLIDQSLFQWPLLVRTVLAMVQVAWSFVIQGRAHYMQIPMVFILLFVVGDWRRGLAIMGIVLIACAAFFLLISVIDVELEGRGGVVNYQFFKEHVLSVIGVEGTPSVKNVEWRKRMINDMFDRWLSSPFQFVVGEGFGLPLLSEETGGADYKGGSDTRQPHNTHLTVLVRLGLVGTVLWVGLFSRIFYVLFQSIREVNNDHPMYGFRLWFLAYFFVCLFHTSVQPWLEFSYGAIPFYVILGYGIMLRGAGPASTLAGELRGGGAMMSFFQRGDEGK